MIEILSDAFASGKAVFLATVVNVEGSAYRHEGGKVLVRSDGTYHGMISGGCLEPEIVEITSQMESGEALFRTFDLRDDSVFGLGLGCGGVIGVLIERVESTPAWQAWVTAQREGHPVVRALVYKTTREDVKPGNFLVIEAGRHTGSSGNEAVDSEVLEKGRVLLSRDRGAPVGLELDGVSLLMDVSRPSPRLVLFGAGDDARPVARLAGLAGFQVTLVDGREGLLTAVRFPAVDLRLLTPDRYSEVEINETTFVVVMHHHLAKDGVALQCALDGRARYIGLLGPPHRFDKVRRLLEGEGTTLPPDALDRIDTPIGLDIGAEGPEEIALSIVAKLVAERRRGTAFSL